MIARVLKVLHRIEREDTADRAVPNRPREERVFALHPDTAQLVHIMVQAARCTTLVEIGVSHGYSTLWLADAARITGGRLTSLEVSPRSIERARRNLDEGGLRDMVDFVEGDARETLRSLHGPVDFVLLDCWDALYVECLPLIVPLLTSGGLLVADNVTPGKPDSDSYISAVRACPQLETVSVPIGRDIEVSVKRLDAS